MTQIDLEKLKRDLRNPVGVLSEKHAGQALYQNGYDVGWNAALDAVGTNLYLASQSKPADGAEGDALAWFNTLVQPLVFNQDKIETIRHALQSAATLQGRVEKLTIELQLIAEFSNEPEARMAQQALARLGE